MAIQQGFVEQRVERPSQYKWPNGTPKSMWSMKVDGVNYGTKNTKPPEEGSYIRFEAEQNGQYWNADASTIQKIEPPTQQAKATDRVGNVYPYTADGVNAAFSDAKAVAKTVDTRQDSIVYQSSRKDAVETVKAMLDAGLIDFGKAKGAQKLELVEIYIDHYTVRYVEDVKRLAPPEHASPKDAEPIAEAQAIVKPARKAPVAGPVLHDGFEDDTLPF